MAKTADDKRNKILEVAKKRFAHYGLAKTTMAEIAKDLAFSKALLYYYFPDKNNLYIAVIEDIVEDLDLSMRKTLFDLKTIDDCVFVFLELRKEFLKRYFYIIEYSFSFRKEVSSEIEFILMKAFAKQLDLLEILFKQAVERKELIVMDAKENASIFLNACGGLRMEVMKCIKNLFVLDKEEFDNILVLEKKFAKIFIDGLRLR